MKKIFYVIYDSQLVLSIQIHNLALLLMFLVIIVKVWGTFYVI